MIGFDPSIPPGTNEPGDRHIRRDTTQTFVRLAEQEAKEGRLKGEATGAERPEGEHHGIRDAIGAAVSEIGEAMAKPPVVLVRLDREDGAYAPGDEVQGTITVTTEHETHVRSVKAGLVRLDTLDVPPEAFAEIDPGGVAATGVAMTDETWAGTDTLVEGVVLPAHSTRDFACRWRLPADAAHQRKGVLDSQWLVRVDVDRPLAPDVHRAAEVHLTVAPS